MIVRLKDTTEFIQALVHVELVKYRHSHNGIEKVFLILQVIGIRTYKRNIILVDRFFATSIKSGELSTKYNLHDQLFH